MTKPQIHAKSPFVLGASDSALPRLFNMARWGLGGRQGSGKQWVSWIHEHDIARVIDWLTNHSETNGIYNCVAPNPVKNARLMQVVRRALHIPIGLPAPKWLLEAGALLIGTETELILKSRWVIPRRLLQLGFTFKYDKIEKAINACINN